MMETSMVEVVHKKAITVDGASEQDRDAALSEVKCKMQRRQVVMRSLQAPGNPHRILYPSRSPPM